MKTSEAICYDTRISKITQNVQLDEVDVKIVVSFRHKVLWNNSFDIRERIRPMIDMDSVGFFDGNFSAFGWGLSTIRGHDEVAYDSMIVLIHFPSFFLLEMFFGEIVGLQNKEPAD